MPFMVVIRSGRRADDGAVVRMDGYAEALRFASAWQRRHLADRLSIFSPALEPLAALAAAQSGSAQPGNRASGTLS